MADDWIDALITTAAAIVDARNSDVLVYAGRIGRPFDKTVIDKTGARARRDNVIFFITTYGGDADAAFRIARCLRRRYKRVTAVVPGFCKSAGTLLLLGADELVMFDHAELGPLDVQISKDDELGERSSGLTPNQAFLSLDAQVRSALESLIVELRTNLLLTTRTASDLATKLVGNLYGGIYAQFDPLRLGEIQRAQAVSLQYGRRLVEVSGIASMNAVYQLVSGYPSHGFVIDREEAERLFPGKVRQPDEHELRLAGLLLRDPVDSSREPLILYVDHPPEAPNAQQPTPQDPGPVDVDT